EGGSTGDDAADYKPLIGFMEFLNNSDDATFLADLSQRLDIEKFAVYEAMMTLLNNGDDISGPGNNSYLYYAPDAKQFTVVPWDMNLAFGGIGGKLTTDGDSGQGQVFIFPAGATPGAIPEGAFAGTPTAGRSTNKMDPSTGEAREGEPGGLNNPLVKRFEADANFAAMIEEQTTELRASLYASGIADSILAARVAVLESGALDLVDQGTITSEAESLATFFTKS
ncbi:MAG: CotH kinase family protein, partial [Thermomicrobiales bacterium]